MTVDLGVAKVNVATFIDRKYYKRICQSHNGIKVSKITGSKLKICTADKRAELYVAL